MLPNAERLLVQGMLMNVVLLKNQRLALSVAEEALLPQGRGNSVFVVREEDGQIIAVKRDVVIGRRRPGAVEIISGLGAGEQVIIHGGMKVDDGKAVNIRARAGKGKPLAELLQ